MIAGRTVSGLGNRNLQLNAMNLTIMRIAARPDFNVATMVPAAEASARETKTPWGWRAALVTEVAIKALKELATRNDGRRPRHRQRRGRRPGPQYTDRVREGHFAGAGRAAVQARQAARRLDPWLRKTFGYDGSLQGDMAYALAAVEFNKKMSAAHIDERRRAGRVCTNTSRPSSRRRVSQEDRRRAGEEGEGDLLGELLALSRRLRLRSSGEIQGEDHPARRDRHRSRSPPLGHRSRSSRRGARALSPGRSSS